MVGHDKRYPLFTYEGIEEKDILQTIDGINTARLQVKHGMAQLTHLLGKLACINASEKGSVALLIDAAHELNDISLRSGHTDKRIGHNQYIVHYECPQVATTQLALAWLLVNSFNSFLRHTYRMNSWDNTPIPSVSQSNHTHR